MPGIVGIISKNLTGSEEEKLNIMIKCMLHEPFYSHGKYINREKGFFLGHVSLEGSFSDCMPIYNENRDLVLLLTGECYYDEDVINDLLFRGHQFDRYDASFLIHLYEEQGDNFFLNLNGWCNGIILDIKRQRAVLFNDRCGIRRIYYHETKDAFIFSSEAKSLLKAYPSLRKLDNQSIGDYLTFDCIFENRTYFRDIFLLPPGSAWKFDHGNLDKFLYFEPSRLENQEIMSKDEDFYDELACTFKRILPRYFMGNSIGMSLTGGLDTRSIMACLNPKSGHLPCYTFGGSYRDIFDVRLAPLVAHACSQSHKILRMDDDKFLSEYPFHVKRSIYITDGLESVDKADSIFFHKLARDVAAIKMSGIYGSQVLKNVSGLLERSPDENLINHDFRNHLRIARDKHSEIKKGHTLSFILFKEIPWWWNGFIASQSSQLSVRSPFLDNEFITLLYKAAPEALNNGAKFQVNLIRKNKPELMSIPSTAGYYNTDFPLLSLSSKMIIKFLGITDKIFIRESVPFSLTHTIGRIDYLLSKIAADKLITGFVDFRRYRVWFRDQLSTFLKDILLSSRTYNRPYWDKNYLQTIVCRHTSGKGTYLREIRKVLQIELIHRELIENI